MNVTIDFRSENQSLKISLDQQVIKSWAGPINQPARNLILEAVNQTLRALKLEEIREPKTTIHINGIGEVDAAEVAKRMAESVKNNPLAGS